MKEQPKFTYSPPNKVFEKQIKTIQDQRIKQAEAFKALKPEENRKLGSSERLFPKQMRDYEIKNEINDIKQWKEKLNQKT